MSETDLAARLEELAGTQTWNREFAKLAWEHKADIIAALRAGEKIEDRLEDALRNELTDVEVEDALTSEGVFVWGPDGERFERMFKRVADARNRQLREALAGIIQHFSVTRWRDNAPGHGHLTPGVWDDDVSNGSNAGQPCEWCAEWKSACALALPTPPAKEAPND